MQSHRPWPWAEYSRTACTAHSCGRFSGADRSAQTRSGGSGARGCRRSPPQSRPSLRAHRSAARQPLLRQAAARSSYVCATSRTLIRNQPYPYSQLAVPSFATSRALIRKYPYPYSQSAVPLFAISRTLIRNQPYPYSQSAVPLFATSRTLIRNQPCPYSQSAVPSFATSRALRPNQP
jgi:hypothetical protein